MAKLKKWLCSTVLIAIIWGGSCGSVHASFKDPKIAVQKSCFYMWHELVLFDPQNCNEVNRDFLETLLSFAEDNSFYESCEEYCFTPQGYFWCLLSWVLDQCGIDALKDVLYLGRFSESLSNDKDLNDLIYLELVEEDEIAVVVFSPQRCPITIDGRSCVVLSAILTNKHQELSFRKGIASYGPGDVIDEPALIVSSVRFG